MNTYESEFKKYTNIDFKEFYQLHLPKLIFFLNGWTKNSEISEDIAVDSFVQCLNKISSYNGEKSKVHTWLYSIARNLAIKHWKDKKKLDTVSMDKSLNTSNKDSNLTKIEMYLHYDDDTDRIDDIRIITKKAKLVKDAILNLPEKQEKYRKVLELREIDLMSYEEIHEHLNLNLSTIKSQIKKGREIIKNKVREDFKILDQC